MLSKRAFLKTNFPLFYAVLCIVIALTLYGGDSSAISLFLSFIVLLGTAVCTAVNPDLKMDKWVGAMLVCWLIFAFASAITGRVVGAEEHYLMSLSAIAMFWLGTFTRTSSQAIETGWRLLLLIGLIFSIFAFFQNVLMPTSILGMDKPYHFNRLSGTFLSSNTTATFLGVIVIASQAQIFRVWRISYAKDHDSETKVLLDMLQNATLPSTTFLFAFVCLLLTASRAGILLTLFSCFLFFLWVFFKLMFDRTTFGRFRVGPAMLVIVGLIVALYLFWNMSGDHASQRYDSIFNDISDRAAMLKASWIAYQYEPIFGHGLGDINTAKLLGVDPAINASVMSQNASHNFFVQSLVQVGVVGLAVMSLVYLSLGFKLLRGILFGQRYTTYLVATVLISFLICSHGLFDYALEIPAVMLTHMWVLGMAIGIQTRYDRRQA